MNNPGAQTTANKKKPRINPLYGGFILFLVFGCACYSFFQWLGSVYAPIPTDGSTPQTTQIEPKLTLQPEPTDAPSATRVPQSTGTSTPSLLEATLTPTAVEIVLDVRSLIGLQLSDAAADFGAETETIDYAAGEADSLPEGGQSHLYDFGEYTIYLDADNTEVVRGVALIDGWEKFEFSLDDWDKALGLVGMEILDEPDLSAPFRNQWDNYEGYGIQVFINGETQHIASVFVYVVDEALLNPAAPPPLNTQLPTAVPPTQTRAPQPTQPLPTQAPLATATEAAPPPTAVPAITVINLTSPISPGADANLTIQTAAGSNCFLGYTTPSGTVSQAQGLGATTADGNGICSWTWRIGSNTNPGTGSLAVTANGITQYLSIVIQ